MNGRNRRSWWHAGLAAAALSAAGVSSALAQTARPAPAAVRAEPRDAVADVELAWLADPITFPYKLSAVRSGDVLEVRGDVPDAIVKNQALNVARVHHRGQIVDRVALTARSAPEPARRTVDELRTALEAKLTQAIPGHGLRVGVDDVGRVTVDGAVRTDAEKQAAIASLRDVPGCLCILNRAQVAPEAVASARPSALPAVPPPPPPATAASPIVPTRGEETSSAPPPAPAPARKPAAPAKTFAGPQVTERSELVRQTVLKACPRALRVQVAQLGPRYFQIQVLAVNDDDGAQYANRIFTLPELQQNHLDVFVHVPE